MKRVGILGSGAVGTTLAAGFAGKGYDVMIGSRDKGKLDSWKAEKKVNVKTGHFDEAAAYGDLLVLAVKGSAAADVVKLAGAENLKGKTVIDTCNPISDAPPEDGVISFFTSLNGSLMEDLQHEYPGANFVKSFSCVGNGQMVDPDFGGEKPTMFIGGDNDNAKKEVKDVLLEFGWEVEDMGTAKAARAIEPLCILWCIPGFRENRWNHAFRLLVP